MIEVGLLVPPVPGREADIARQAEAEDFDVALYGDSQALLADPYTRMTAAAAATNRIRVATGVTNPVTRHPSVTAAAIAAVQAESGGRAMLGIGRGDSALGHIGLDYPAPLRVFREYLVATRAYLRGEAVNCDGFESRLRWLPADLPPVPIDIACAGPRMIRLAAELADRASFCVGSAPERVKWALGQLTEGLARSGREPAAVQVGAYLVVAVTDDRAAARAAMRGAVAGFAHFSGMRDSDTSHLTGDLRAVSEELKAGYRTEDHFRSDASHGHAISDDFLDGYAIIGAPDEVVERLGGLIDLGLRHLYLVIGSIGADPGFLRASRKTLVTEVLPALRARPSAVR